MRGSKYTLRNSDDFLNSRSLRYSRLILVIRAKSNGGSGIRLDPSAIMILRSGHNHNRRIHAHHKGKGKIKQIFIDCVVCAKKDITLYIMVSLLTYVRIKPHVDVALLLQCDWILDRSVKHAVRRLDTSCLLPGVKVAYLEWETHS